MGSAASGKRGLAFGAEYAKFFRHSLVQRENGNLATLTYPHPFKTP